MRGMITREVTCFSYNVLTVENDSVKKLGTVNLYNDNINKAIKEAKKAFPEHSNEIIVRFAEKVSGKYGMTLDEFIASAKKID